MKPKYSLALAVLTSVFSSFVCQRVSAQIVTNGGFESSTSPFVSDGNGAMTLPVGSTLLSGWTVTGGSLAWIQNVNVFGFTSPYGSHFLDLTGYRDVVPLGGLTQTLSTIAGQEYAVSLALGSDPGSSAYSGSKSVTVSAGSSSATLTFSPTSALTTQWGEETFDFVANSASTILSIVGAGTGSGNQLLGLDNISVSAVTNSPGAVPEPGTYGIFGLAMIALLACRRTILKIRS